MVRCRPGPGEGALDRFLDLADLAICPQSIFAGRARGQVGHSQHLRFRSRQLADLVNVVHRLHGELSDLTCMGDFVPPPLGVVTIACSRRVDLELLSSALTAVASFPFTAAIFFARSAAAFSCLTASCSDRSASFKYRFAVDDVGAHVIPRGCAQVIPQVVVLG